MGLEPTRFLDQRILSPSRIPIPPLAPLGSLQREDSLWGNSGGTYEIRTRVSAFAELRLTPRPTCQNLLTIMIIR